MENIFKLSDYTEYYDAMMCSSKEEADFFRKFLHENGRSWSSGASYIETDHYDKTSTENIFAFNSGLRGVGLNTHRSMGYNVLRFSDFDWSGFTDPFAEYEPSISLNEFLDSFTNAMR